MNMKNNIFALLIILYGAGCPITFDSYGMDKESVSTTSTTSEINTNSSEFESTTLIPTTSNISTSTNTSEISTGDMVTSNFTTGDFTTIDFTTSTTNSENQTSTGESIPVCGNFILEGDEECDEGLGNETCTAYCKISFCGDGNINLLANEECDDQNLTDEDECSNECIRPRWVFLTSDYIGPPKFGGIKQADDFCQADAIKFGYPGTFRAWLSDSDPLNDPIVRFGDFSIFKGWYRLPSDPPLLIAKGPNFQFGLLNSINVMPMGSQDLMVISVWTNTQPNGLAVNYEDNCNNWTSNEGSSLTYVGSPHSITPDWTMYGWKMCSSGVGSKLYCFETNK